MNGPSTVHSKLLSIPNQPRCHNWLDNEMKAVSDELQMPSQLNQLGASDSNTDSNSSINLFMFLKQSNLHSDN